MSAPTAGAKVANTRFRVQQTDGSSFVAPFVLEAAERTADILRSRWRLAGPAACEIHVTRDAVGFVLSSAPPRWRWVLSGTRPVWRGRATSAFAVAGGVTMPWPHQPAIAVKPPEDLVWDDRSLGARLFVPVSDPRERLAHVVCHEVTHAFTARLRLPAWLNEGVAMRAVDHFAGGPTVRGDSAALAAAAAAEDLGRRALGRLGRGDPARLVRLYANGYWKVKALDEDDGAELRELLEHGGLAWSPDAGQP